MPDEEMTPLKLHPREAITRRAERELLTTLISIQKYLTEGEYLKIVSNRLSDCFSTHATYVIRYERHGNTDDPGGWE